MKDWLLIFRNVMIALFVIAVGEAIPQLQALEQWMAPRRSGLVWTTAGITFVGWAFLIGATILRARHGGRALKRNEIEASVKSVKDTQAMPFFFRVSKYWVPNKSRGAGFSDEVSFRQFKEAFRQKLWLRDPRWAGMFVMGLGAMMMTIGGFGLIIVLASPGMKFLAACALCYAAARTTQGFLRA